MAHPTRLYPDEDLACLGFFERDIFEDELALYFLKDGRLVSLWE
jgi:hypothetical protein